jgi:uncharacterized protein (TIGR03437 family)
VQVRGLGRIVTIAAGGNHALALQDDGTVWAWGTNWTGQLGDGTIAEQQAAPVQVRGLEGVVAIAAGSTHSLAAKRDGTVWAWGWNGFGELGDATTTQRLTPVRVSGLTEVVAVAGGGGSVVGAHSLALRRDGTVWVWGHNGSGQLGDGTTTDRLTPVQVAGLSEVAAIAAGDAHSLALKRGGTVWAWGSNESGQLGGGRIMSRATPGQVAPPGAPDLAMAMSHDGDFTVGGQGVYTLTIANIGLTATAGEISVTDTLPLGLAYVSAAGTGWSCSATDRTVTCTTPGAVEPGASSNITLTVNVGAAGWPGVTNLAIVSNASDRNVVNNAMGDPTVVLPGPVLVSAVVNAASFRTGPIAPGEIVSIFGKEMGPATGVFENIFGQTRVLFDGTAAPVLFARADQVTAVAPYALAGRRSTEVQVEYRGVTSSPVALAVAESAPGLFTANATGSGQGAILNEDGSLNSASKPARRGSLVTLLATGEGQTSLPVTVLIGGQQAVVSDAGQAPGLAGVLQVRAWAPGPVTPGPAVPITLVVGGAQSQPGVTVAVQ